MTAQKPIRLLPGIVAGLVVLAGLAVPFVIPDAAIVGLIGGIVGALAIAVWWVFFSRVPWSERLGAIALAIAAGYATWPFLDKSIAGAGMGMLFPMFGIQTVSVALVAWAVVSVRLSGVARPLAKFAGILMALAVFTLLRTGGIIGGARSDVHWRWTPTPEERLLSQASNEPVDSARGGPAVLPSTPAAPAIPEKPPIEGTHPAAPAATDAEDRPSPPAVASKPADWPGFRGPDRNGVVRGVRINTDWSTTPPMRLWHRPIGPGWSSFAVDGDLLFTQEQRGDEELVASYRVSTGEPVWRHRSPVRFYESNGGAGPRGTPSLSNGRVYAFGATGVLSALDAATGAAVWSRNVATDSKTEVPMWGFSSSPLVIDDEVVVAAAGTLASYDVTTGKPRWVGPAGGMSYSSPHQVTIEGVRQILLLSGGGATSVAPADGTVLWKHVWGSGAIVQPAVTTDNNILINSLATTGGQGVRRLAIAHATDGQWTVAERWTSTGLKPYFSDFVVHNGHAYGFDGSILSCIDLADGARKWKGGRYGSGQLVLLPDQDLLLVVSEEGDLALVSATPDQFKEIARVPAIEGKTWNHPVVVGDILLIRNGEEMAAFRLPLAAR